jgi:hypothetical protein
MMDYGPFVNLALNAPGGAGGAAGGAADNNTFKAIAIPLGTNEAGRPSHGGRNEAPPASVCFDQDLLRYSAGWVDGFMDYEGVSFHGAHGRNPSIRGTLKWATVKGPGWANPADGSFADPRTPYDPKTEVRQGPLPAEWAKFKGIYRHGDQVVLSYTVGKAEVLETPGMTGEKGNVVFTRAFTVGASDKALVLNVANVDKATARVENGVATLTDDKGVTTAAGSSSGTAKVDAKDGAIRLTIPARGEATSFTLSVWSGPADGVGAFASSLGKSQPVDLHTFAKGGEGIWKETVETKVTAGKGDGAYVVDTYEPPFKNPYAAVVRFGGMDFLPDGKSAVLSTWQGDVWKVSDISGSPETVTWRRIASGLFEPLGLKVRDGEIFVHCRDGLWRLNDLNGDGEVD